MFSKLRHLLILPNPFERGVNDYWRVRLINAYLLLTLVVFSFFTVFNIAVVGLYANAIADIIGLAMALATVYDYRRKRHVGRTSVLVVLNIYLISIAIIMVAAKDYGILLWSIFAPIFSFFLLGRIRGLIATLAYYVILIAYLASQLGSEVSVHLFVEFVMVSVILVAVIYHYELNRSMAYDLIHKASVEDALTGLHNRRWFNRKFESEYHRALRLHQPYAFFIMDIDHFKHYNDANGHDKGDEVLKKVAAILEKNMRRSGDDIFRLGGEEFGGILSSEKHADIEAHVERLRREIEELAIPLDSDSERVVTASFGLSVTIPDESITPTVIYREADQALYRAKEQGRNRVEKVEVRAG